jgi:hypothetical protein
MHRIDKNKGAHGRVELEPDLRCVLPARLWFMNATSADQRFAENRGFGGTGAARLWFISGKDMV